MPSSPKVKLSAVCPAAAPSQRDVVTDVSRRTGGRSWPVRPRPIAGTSSLVRSPRSLRLSVASLAVAPSKKRGTDQ
jgi:hypothetical protein